MGNLAKPQAELPFREKGYVVVRGALNGQTADVLTTYCTLQRNTPGYYRSDSPSSAGRYADVVGESLLCQLQAVLERETGFRLEPAYSYLRIYESGATLHKHTDRPSCEVSATLTIGYDAPRIWPICIDSDGRKLDLDLDRGDLLVYMGSLIPHWRETFEGTRWIQVFLHYVIADGALSAFRYDMRPGIAVPTGPGASRAGLGALRRTLAGWREGRRARRYRRVAQARPVATLPADRLRGLAGIYRLAPHDVLKIVVLEDKVLVQVYLGRQHSPLVEFFPASDAELFSKQFDAQLKVVRDDGSGVSGVVLVRDGRESPATRVRYPVRIAGAS